MRRLAMLVLFAGSLAMIFPGGAEGQDPSAFLEKGEMAPDFQVTGATRYGVIAEPLSLSDFRGETVVLAFFFKARTGG